MAVGDVVKGFSSIAAGSYLDVLPTGTEQWVIHNYRFEGPVEFYITTNGTDLFKYETVSASGAWEGLCDHVTSDYYIKIKNTDSVTRKITYDGIQTK